MQLCKLNAYFAETSLPAVVCSPCLMHIDHEDKLWSMQFHCWELISRLPAREVSSDFLPCGSPVSTSDAGATDCAGLNPPVPFLLPRLHTHRSSAAARRRCATCTRTHCRLLLLAVRPKRKKGVIDSVPRVAASDPRDHEPFFLSSPLVFTESRTIKYNSLWQPHDETVHVMYMFFPPASAPRLTCRPRQLLLSSYSRQLCLTSSYHTFIRFPHVDVRSDPLNLLFLYKFSRL